MKKLMLLGMIAAVAAFAQAPAQAPAAANKGPAPKSQAEVEALQALFAAQSQTPDAVITAADNLITKFADTQFKGVALFMEAEAYKAKKDYIKAQLFYDQAIAFDPKDYRSHINLGEVIVQHVGQNDLDREEKLTKAEKELNSGIDALKAAEKPNPQMTDDQWNDAKKMFTGQADDDLGLIALQRKKYDAAVTDFRAAVDADPQEPAHAVRLASALQQSGKNDEAITICDKVLAEANIHPAIRQACTGIKTQATAAKGK